MTQGIYWHPSDPQIGVIAGAFHEEALDAEKAGDEESAQAFLQARELWWNAVKSLPPGERTPRRVLEVALKAAGSTGVREEVTGALAGYLSPARPLGAFSERMGPILGAAPRTAPAPAEGFTSPPEGPATPSAARSVAPPESPPGMAPLGVLQSIRDQVQKVVRQSQLISTWPALTPDQVGAWIAAAPPSSGWRKYVSEAKAKYAKGIRADTQAYVLPLTKAYQFALTCEARLARIKDLFSQNPELRGASDQATYNTLKKHAFILRSVLVSHGRPKGEYDVALGEGAFTAEAGALVATATIIEGMAIICGSMGFGVPGISFAYARRDDFAVTNQIINDWLTDLTLRKTTLDITGEVLPASFNPAVGVASLPADPEDPVDYKWYYIGGALAAGAVGALYLASRGKTFESKE